MSYSFSFALGLGLLLGIRHATDADHLIAVTTIVSEQRSILRSAAVGVLWGLGHTISLFLAGLLIVALNVTIPEKVAMLLELCVAAMIIFLGTRILYLLLKNQRGFHVHTHQHGGRAHSHLHFHDRSQAHAVQNPVSPGHGSHGGPSGWRPVIVGMVHGLAGSAALPLLVLTELSRGGSRWPGLAYLAIFGLGSVFGMLFMSAVISLPFIFTASRIQRFYNPLRLTAGLASILFGIYYAWHIAAPFA